MQHDPEIMVDIETLGTKPGAQILSIGAAVFRRHGYIPLATRHWVLDLDEQDHLGLEADPKAMEWWAGQSPQAWAAATKNPTSVDTVLNELDALYDKYEPTRTWTQGNNFDPVLLEALYGKLNREAPWQFWQVRDTRTVYDEHGYNTKQLIRSGAHHNALDDCMHQIECLKAARLSGIVPQGRKLSWAQRFWGVT